MLAFTANYSFLLLMLQEMTSLLTFLVPVTNKKKKEKVILLYLNMGCY